MKWLARLTGAGIAVLRTLTPLSAQCAMCRKALESPEAAHLAAALRSGIVVLLAAPFLAFGTVAFLAVRAQRRSS